MVLSKQSDSCIGLHCGKLKNLLSVLVQDKIDACIAEITHTIKKDNRLRHIFDFGSIHLCQ